MSDLKKQLEEGYVGTMLPQSDKQQMEEREFLLYKIAQELYTRDLQLPVKTKANYPLHDLIAQFGAVLKEYRGVKRKHVPPTKFTTVKNDVAVEAMLEMEQHNRKKPQLWQMGKPINEKK